MKEIIERICNMERDLTFYEISIVALAESIRDKRPCPIIANGSQDAVHKINILYKAIQEKGLLEEDNNKEKE